MDARMHNTVDCRFNLSASQGPRSKDMWGGVAGLSQGYCLVSLSLSYCSTNHSNPTPPDISQCPAEFIYAIIMLSCHVSCAVSTLLLCLAPVCQHAEELPPAIAAVNR